MMIGKDEELVLAAIWVILLGLKVFNNSQELLIVSLVPSLSEDYFLREKDF